MSKRVLILVEGQTEERFVKDVLGPAFWEKELFFASSTSIMGISSEVSLTCRLGSRAW